MGGGVGSLAGFGRMGGMGGMMVGRGGMQGGNRGWPIGVGLMPGMMPGMIPGGMGMMGGMMGPGMMNHQAAFMQVLVLYTCSCASNEMHPFVFFGHSDSNSQNLFAGVRRTNGPAAAAAAAAAAAGLGIWRGRGAGQLAISLQVRVCTSCWRTNLLPPIHYARLLALSHGGKKEVGSWLRYLHVGVPGQTLSASF